MAAQPENLRMSQATAALDSTNTAYIELRSDVFGACQRLAEVSAALRIGRLIDAHEVLLDVQADLRAALNEPA